MNQFTLEAFEAAEERSENTLSDTKQSLSQDEITENNSDSLSNLSNLLSNPSETSHKTEENGNLVTEVTQVTQNKDGVLVSILKDFNVAWKDKDWYLHSQDLVHLDEELAATLIKREVARKVDLSQSRPPTNRPSHEGGHDTSMEVI